ncbi:wax ester/triacylglycerol synthase domain-containing protein [Mycobacterium avium]|uniref:wax ester/triacylglycerol synthase domain-containing protein n=1 Tax=Mycobacterium avium TaxID=1764 RepID=UPI000CE53CA0|nr:wax ester/triacylglycerol synthase domain-containing protein [Mycobacterium avium]
MTNVLDLVDQVHFLGERATGAVNLVQCVWVYDRAVDIDGLRRFHQHLGRGRLRRRIERSPLPFGRHRWVSAVDQSELEITATPRPRSELDAWCSEQAGKPLDAEHGPGWHLAVLSFTEGGAAVSLVTSHCLTDGVGLCQALADAASGRADAVAWPAAGSRRRRRAIREDARQTVCDTRDIGRAVAAAARLAGAGRRSSASSAPSPVKRPTTGADERIAVPTATIFVDADAWDARVQALGGTDSALLAGLAARLAQRLGRVTADGSVEMTMPVDDRGPGDARANAITNADFVVDPTPATTDLREIRAAIMQALSRHQDAPDERWALLPLVPLIPKRLFKRMINVATGNAMTVASSNLGTIDPAVNRPDGTDADYFATMSLYPGVTKATMLRVGGVLGLITGRSNGHVFVSVRAYQPGRTNSKDELRQSVSEALIDFSLTDITTLHTGCAPRAAVARR